MHEIRTHYSNQRLHELIEAQGVTLVWLGEQIGVDPSYITKLRYGDKPLTDDLVRKFARLFRVPVSYFAESIEEGAA